MRQTFFHELEELEKQKNQEKKEKERVELYLRKQNRAKNIREWIPFFSALIFALVSSLIVVYALYLFINISKMGNISDVHLTNVLNLAIRTYKGEVYNNFDLGIKNWMVFVDEKNGFEIRYPENWKYKKNEAHLFEIRKYNSQASINESLSAIGFIDVYENEKMTSIEEFVFENFGISKDNFSKKERDGMNYFETGLMDDHSGASKRIVFWEQKGRVYSFEVIFYNKKNRLAENDFEKIISVIEIKK